MGYNELYFENKNDKKDNLIILALLFRNEGHGGRAFKRLDTISTSKVELLFSIKQNN